MPARAWEAGAPKNAPHHRRGVDALGQEQEQGQGNIIPINSFTIEVKGFQVARFGMLIDVVIRTRVAASFRLALEVAVAGT
jgi:hypothetical protein